jgi:glutamine synthetase
MVFPDKRQGFSTMSNDLASLADQSQTKFILALFVDLRGKPCAKLVPVEAVDLLATEGVGFAGYAVGAMGQEPKDPDLMAIPDPDSFTPIPFLKDGLAIVHCDPHVEGLPWPYAPRVILKEQLAAPRSWAWSSRSAPRSSTSSSSAARTAPCARPTRRTPRSAPATTRAG